MFMVDISVLIPVYNVEKYLPRCLDSVINQTFKGEYEIICVNDGSTDKSACILEEYAKKSDKIKIINQKNEGLSEARNTGVEYAAGKYVLFVDSDDIISSFMLEKLYNYAEKHDSEVVIFDFYSGNENFKELERHHFKNIVQKYGDSSFNIETAEPFVYRFIPVATWLKLYRLDLIKNIKFEKGLNNQDVPHWALIYSKAQKVNYFPRAYYYYMTKRDTAITQTTNEKVFDVFKAFSLTQKILADAGHFDKLKNIHYAHLICNLVIILQKINPEIREQYIQKIKEFEMDIDYEAFLKENFFSFEKDNMRLIKFIRENDFEAINAHLKKINIW